ncbi:hypothetical protein, partial [Xanthomonas phaseoli]|uniref:hypothetical protein n=1 Tax=Xanthomonas phaseoli TaxID=1985254 RepID=UPI003CE5A626
DPAPGIHAWRFEPALVHAVDALFAGRPADALSNDAPAQGVANDPEPLSPRERGWGEGTSAPGTPTP